MQTTETMTVTVPSHLVQQVRELASAQGYNQFIVDAVEAFIADKRRNKTLRDELIAGYQATSDAMRELNAELESTDFVDWDRHIPTYDESRW